MKKKKLDEVQKNQTAHPDVTNINHSTEKYKKEREERYRTILEDIKQGYFETDLAGNITFFNDTICMVTGYPPEELMGMNNRYLMDKKELKKVFQTYNKVYKTGEPNKELVSQITSKDGTKRYIELSVSLIKDLSGKPTGFRGILRDITERKQTEEKLRDEDQLFRAVTEYSSDMIILTNPQGVNIYMNRAIEKNLGYTIEERIHANGFEIVHPDDLKRIMDYFLILSTDTNSPVIKGETRLRHKNGTWCTFETVASNIVKNNAVDVLIINHHNITERKQIENDLRESERNFRLSLDESPLGIRISTMEGETIYANRAILDIYGYDSVEELKETSIKDRYTQESYAAFQERKKKRLQSGIAPSEYEISIVRKNGEIRHLHAFRKEILWDGKKQSQVIYQDITERKRAEEAAVNEFNFSRSALDVLTVPFFMFDPIQMNFFRWNKAFSTISGYSDEEIARMRPLNLVPESECDRLKYLAKEFEATGHVSFEMPALTRNGDTIPYLVAGNFLTYDGKPYVVGMGINIADLKKVEEDLKKSEERYRSVFENAGLPLMIIEDSLLIFMVNDRFTEMSGYSKDDIEGKMKFTDFIVPEDRNALMECLARRKRDKPVEYECQIHHCNGNKFDVLVRIGQIPKAGQFIASYTDITSRKKAEFALLKSQEHLQKENIRLRSSIRERYRFCDIIGKSRVMQEVYEFILQAAATDANVIIYGESGTGKELVAKAIHETSDKNRNKFVTVNCGAIPETLMESEFFGYKKGSFTGANADKPGYLDEADGGTLFLDEVGEIGLNMQVKLLRAIAGDGYTPVGSSTKKNANFRIIAATNRNLRDMTKRGTMREDFFYRIHILPVYLPPLRERKDDIPLLLDHFLPIQENNELLLPGHIVESMLKYDWPGNIRELQSVLHRYLTLKRLDFIGMSATKLYQTETPKNRISVIADSSLSATPESHAQKEQANDYIQVEESSKTLEAIERDHIIRILSEHNWHRGRTASALGIHRKTLFLKMQKLGLNNQ